MTQTTTFKAESTTRWYTRESMEIVEKVPLKTPVKIKDDEGNVTGTRTTTNPTIRHARESGYLPSVTSIIKSLINPEGIVKYVEQDAITVAANYSYSGDSTPEDIEQRYVPMILAKRKEYSEATQNMGKLLHKDKELYFMQGREPETIQGKNIILGYEEFMRKHGAQPDKIKCEQPFGSALSGYAGTPDDYMSDVDFIVDLKTKEKHKTWEGIKTYKQLHLSWKLQLGAYRIIAPNARLWQAVASQETGETRFIELKDPDLWAQAFQGIFTTWCAEKEYDPRNWVGKEAA